MIYLAMFLTGLIAGRLAVVLSCWFLNDETTVQPARLGIARCAKCEQSLSAAAIQFKGLMKSRVICPGCRNSGPVWPSLVSAVTAIIFAGFTWLLIEGNCQTITEVRPSHQLVFDRLPFQLIFIFLMLVVTVTDLIDYAIPDFIIWIGIVVAVAGSTASGDLQMVHIWVDWSYELVEIYGPWLPEWMKHHQHLHGAAWSIAGLVTGAGIMLLIRIISSVILGQAAV
ncbi:MAG: hypothetical protein R3C20_24920, partial [Planctomycetaceae bacterium]